MNDELTLTDYLRRVRATQGITLKEMGQRMGAKDGSKPRHAPTEIQVGKRIMQGEKMTVRSLRELCEAMDCELDIRIIPKIK